MKEYITKTLYEEPNLIIGSNNMSIILGQKDNWVILDKGQVSEIQRHFSSGIGPLKLDGVSCKQNKNNILLSQLDSLISVNKNLISNNLLK